MINLSRLLSPLLFGLSTALPAWSQAMPDPVVRAEALSGWNLPDGRRVAALRLTLAPGWKTYWRAPGDAGIPPHFDWSRAGNIEDVQISWPTPHVFADNGMRSVGYSGEVVLPLHITPKRSDRPMRLRTTVSMGVCADICIPYQLEVNAELAPPASSPPPAIVAALADMPYSAGEAGVTGATCVIAPSDHGMQVTARITLPHTGGTEAAVIEAGNPAIWVSEPATQRYGDTLTATSEMMHPSGGPFSVDRSAIRITVLGGNYAVDIRGCTAG
ncbi:MAG: protein-disulfide reductase DsbD domain-containing protein [Pseudomonadota bacterium]